MKEEMMRAGAMNEDKTYAVNEERNHERGILPDDDAEKVKLKSDGNITRQILDAIGFETLQSEPKK